MQRILLALLILVPLFASSAFSEFEVPKWALASVLAAGAALMSGQSGLDQFLNERKGLFFVSLATPGVLLLSAVASFGTDLPSSLIDSGRLGLPVVIAVLVCLAWRGHDKMSGLIVGALVPLLLVLAQWLLASEVFPLDVPHRPNLWTSTIGNGALLAECALVLFGFVVALMRILKPQKSVLYGFLLGLPAVFLIYIGDSRAVWLGAVTFVAALIALEFLAPKKSDSTSPLKKVVVPAAILLGGILVAVVAMPDGSLQASFGARLKSITDSEHPTNIVRRELRADALELFGDNVALGVGGGRFGSEHSRVRSKPEWVISGLESRVDDPHNEYLRFLSEYGILGASLILLALAVILRGLWGRRSCAIARTTLALWAAILLISTTWGVFLHPGTMIPLAFLTGLSLASKKPMDPELIAVGHGKKSGLILGLSLVFAVCFCTWAERDSAAVALRDKGERLKAEFESAQSDPVVSARALADLGGVGKSINRVGQSSWIRPAVRYRLLKTVYNLAEERTVLEAIQPVEGNTGANMLLVAARQLPSLADARTLARTQLKYVPAHLGTHRLLGRLETLAGNKAAAVTSLEDALKVNQDDPFSRQLLAELYVEGDTRLYKNALALADDQVSRWGDVAEASDKAWQMKARCLGALGKIGDALACIKEWTDTLGDTDDRMAVGGEMSLYFSETPDTVGLFIADERTWGYRQERGIFTSGSFEGLTPAVKRKKILAHLGRHPHDTPAIDSLRDVLFDLIHATGDRDAQMERMRDRAIARSRIHYAWENLRDKNERGLRVCLRIARQKAPNQADAYLIEMIHAVRKDDMAAALKTLRAWKNLGVSSFPALQKISELESFLKEPEVQKLISG